MSPLLNDIQALVKEGTGTPELFISDILNLRALRLKDALDLLGGMQNKIEAELAEARQTATARVSGLEAVATGLKKIAQALLKLGSRLDSAFAPLRNRLASIEDWYDTVMQSFEERYNRSMKMWTIGISLVVVVLFNADFFSIYQNLCQ